MNVLEGELMQRFWMILIVLLHRNEFLMCLDLISMLQKRLCMLQPREASTMPIHPLNRRYRVDHLDLHYHRLAGQWYVDHLVSKTKSVKLNTEHGCLQMVIFWKYISSRSTVTLLRPWNCFALILAFLPTLNLVMHPSFVKSTLHFISILGSIISTWLTPNQNGTTNLAFGSRNSWAEKVLQKQNGLMKSTELYWGLCLSPHCWDCAIYSPSVFMEMHCLWRVHRDYLGYFRVFGFRLLGPSMVLAQSASKG